VSGGMHLAGEPTVEWERHDDGSYTSIPIRPRDLDAVREWCAENCGGDFLIDLGRRIIFQLRDDAVWRHSGGAVKSTIEHVPCISPTPARALLGAVCQGWTTHKGWLQ